MAKKARPKKKGNKTTARPSALDMVRNGAAMDARHLSSRDIQREMDRISSALEVTNDAISEKKAELNELTRARTAMIAQLEGISSVLLSRR